MQLSVVIPTKNRAAKLGRTLESLKAQTVSPEVFEVLVVDNGSDDGTAEIIRNCAESFAHWKPLEEPRRGAAAARNRGVGASQGEIVLFLDDDVLADPHLIEEHLTTHREHPGCVVLGYVRNAWKGTESAFHWALSRRNLLHSFRFADPLNVPFLHFYTCNLSLPRAVLLRVGFFDAAFTGWGFEDTDLGYRVCHSGHRIVFNPRAAALHDPELSFEAFAKKRFNAGRALRYLLKKHPDLRGILVPNRWRRVARYWAGYLATPLEPWFDRSMGNVPISVFRAMGRLCWYALEYHFWAGFQERSSGTPEGETRGGLA